MERGHLGVVKLLLRQGADVDVLNKANKTAAELASENGQAEVAKFISEYKADADIRNNIRSTTLDSTESTQFGADEDGKDEQNASLHAAAEEGNINAVKSLLERGVDIDGRNARYETPLDRAAEKGHVDVVRLLVERGAEVDSCDERGWTPLILCITVRTPRSLAGAHRSRRKRERKEPESLDPYTRLSRTRTPCDCETVA